MAPGEKGRAYKRPPFYSSSPADFSLPDLETANSLARQEIEQEKVAPSQLFLSAMTNNRSAYSPQSAGVLRPLRL